MFRTSTGVSPTVRTRLLLLVIASVMAAGCSANPATTTPAVMESSALVEPPVTSRTTEFVIQLNGKVQVVRAEGQARVLAPEAPGSQEHPDWSWDGLELAFDAGFTELWTVKSDGSGARSRFTCEAPCAAIQDPAWSPDGTEIAFVMAETKDGKRTARSSIEALNVATGKRRTIYGDTSGTVWLFHPRWSPDARSIVFEEATFVSNLLAEQATTAHKIAVVSSTAGSRPRYLTGPDKESTEPDWSPITDLVVFTREFNLFAISANGSQERKLTDFDGTTGAALQPTFTPDGTRLVFTQVAGSPGSGSDRPFAALLNLDGTGLTPLAGGDRATHPRLRPSA